MAKRSIFNMLHEDQDTGLLPGIGYYEKISDNEYHVTNEKGNTYVVEKDNANWRCSCPSFKYSGKGTCKHIEALVREGVISLPIERLPMNLIDDVVIPAIDPVMTKYIPDWQDFIVGSYRRKKDTFKDIDIIIPLDVQTFHNLMDEIREVPGFEFIMGKDDIFRGMFPVGNVNGKDRKVELDFSRQNTDSQAGMTLYRTGPASLNTFMRQVAQTHGWSLSEKGLIDHVTGEKARVPQDTETDIFDTLGIPYLNPDQREHWEDFINADQFLSDARQRNNSRSRDVIYKLRDWFRDHPEWKDVGLSLHTKDNVNALKGRLKTHNSIDHIVKYPYGYELSKAFEYAYGEKLPPNS